MPAPYSLDLRKKVLEAYERGERKSHICREFNISRNTLDLWIKRRLETGTVEANTDYRRGPKPKISDLEEFSEFVVKNGNLTQKQMALKWPEPVSRVLIGKAIKKIGFTRKKKRINTGKKMRQIKVFENYYESCSGKTGVCR